jgi:toxin CcdB
MAQFDVHRSPGRNRVHVPYVVVVQSQRLDHLPTRLVIPLAIPGNLGHEELRMVPIFMIEGQRVVLLPWQIQTVRTALLGPVIGSLSGDPSADEIVHAIDMVITRAFG